MSDDNQSLENHDDLFGKIRLTESEVIHDESNYVISIRNIHKTYLLGIEGVAALRGVSLSIESGEYLCIYGTSGGGKTTLLNVIGTIDKPSKGDMQICESKINEGTSDKRLSFLRLRKIGFVFQTFNLITSMTALENVELPMILAGKLSFKKRRQRAIELLTKVGMEGRIHHKPSQMSGGEQQRVTIARALANDPEVLLLDEPTGDLDSYNSALVMKLLMELHSEGITLIMVTHDVSLKNLADRVVWMRDGLIGKIEIVEKEKREESEKRIYSLLELKKVVIGEEMSIETEYRQPNDYLPVKYQNSLN